jgi:hypothetical protein
MNDFATLVQRGCLCGSKRPADCPLHGPRDNRGLLAFFKAGQPGGFPMAARCALCGDDGLLYPNVEIDDPRRSGEFRPTLICPRCSRPSSEQALRTDAEAFGYLLNDRCVFSGEHSGMAS